MLCANSVDHDEMPHFAVSYQCSTLFAMTKVIFYKLNNFRYIFFENSKYNMAGPL